MSREEREKLIKHLKYNRSIGADYLITDKDADEIIKALEQEPSVTPTRKKGKWIMTSDYLTTAYGSVDYVKCSCCGEDSLEEGDFYPNCEAKMESEE